MSFDPHVHNRRSIRLPGYDYSQPGEYFVTICTAERQCILGDVSGGDMQAGPLGEIVTECWHELPVHYLHVELDAFVLMPNHVHGIIVLSDDKTQWQSVGAGLKPAPNRPRRRHGLGEIVRGFKTFSTRRGNEARATPSGAVWQRNYYEHIVRDEAELDRIRDYILQNPLNWQDDPDNPMLQREGRV